MGGRAFSIILFIDGMCLSAFQWVVASHFAIVLCSTFDKVQNVVERLHIFSGKVPSLALSCLPSTSAFQHFSHTIYGEMCHN